MKTLVVESDPSVRDILRKALELRGHEVTTVDNGKACLEQYLLDAYPLVITNADLPEMDGLQLCRRIRSMPAAEDTFIIIITDEATADVLDGGADDFLTTPLRTGLLNARLAIAERDALARAGRRRRENAAREIDRRLSAVIANAPVGILALDTDKMIRQIKGRALESFGHRSTDLIGSSIDRVCSGQPSVHEAIDRALKGASSACLGESNGHRLEIRWSPEVNADGQVTGVLGVFVGLDQVGESVSDSANGNEPKSFYGLIGQSQAMRVLFEQVREVARVDWTVLIEGETGSGKELIARAIHEDSPRSNEPFIAVNCGSLTESLLASQLFGHRRGAFTGAMKDQKGLFEAANGGTLFLDEIGEISRAVQVSLLRVLESREITRVGEARSVKVNTRVITATNRNLADAVADGSFRADLFYRLRIARLRLPPLRERIEDIPDLAWHFLDLSREATGKPIADIDPMAMELMACHKWPGNVRELKSAIDYAVLRCQGTIISRDDLPHELLEGCTAEPARLSDVADPRERLLQALREADGNRSKAARLLGVSRATFYRYLTRFEIGDGD